MPTPTHRSRRDGGMTLLETITAVTVLGMVTVFVVGAVAVVFRTQSGVTNTTASSHDIQHAVSFFHSDVQSALNEMSAFRATSGTTGDTGSGCSEAGDDNILRFDTGEIRIAYRLEVEGDTARLDRYRCVLVDSTWTEESSINIADLLDATDGPAARADVVARDDDPTSVDRVVLSLASAVLGDQEISAAPREGELAAAPPPAVEPGECASAVPFAALDGIQSAARGDFHLVSNHVWRSLAVGGALSFDGQAQIGHSLGAGDYPTAAGLETAALYAGSIDWSATTARSRIEVRSGSDAAIADGSNLDTHVQGGTLRVFELGDAGRDPRLEVERAASLLTGPVAYDLDAAFETLIACASRVALFPGVCDDCATHVELLAINGRAYTGTEADSRVRIVLDPARANVLNLTPEHLDDLTQIRVDGTPTAAAPLIINVTAGADATVEVPTLFSTSSVYTLWNFSDATGTLTIDSGGVDGTILAPQAHIVTDARITGGLIGATVTYSGPGINTEGTFEGEIRWAG